MTYTYDEIQSNLISVDYQHAFHQRPEGECVDMHGIALKVDPGDS